MYRIEISYKDYLLAVWTIRAQSSAKAIIGLRKIIGNGYVLKQGRIKK